MTNPTRRCEPGESAARHDKAQEFFESARLLEGAPNAVVSLLVLAAIAASDAICCVRLGRRSSGDDHAQAVAVLAEVSPNGRQLAEALRDVLRLKTRAAYGATDMTDADVKRATRRVQRLVEEARSVV